MYEVVAVVVVAVVVVQTSDHHHHRGRSRDNEKRPGRHTYHPPVSSSHCRTLGSISEDLSAYTTYTNTNTNTA